MKYLHEQRPGMYRELLLTGKLTEHCTIESACVARLIETGEYDRHIRRLNHILRKCL